MSSEEKATASIDIPVSAHATVILGAESYRRLAEANGFRQETLEKVIRLGHVIAALNREPELSPKLALKGGTAINLMTDPIRRLSVDLDFNYVGALDREAMLADKPVVLAAFAELARRLDYNVRAPKDAHGGSTFSLHYKNSLGTQDQIEIDINWITRVPLGPLQKQHLWQPEGLEKPEVQMVANEELIVGKLRALIDRTAARDVFDTGYLPELLPDTWPSPLVKALFILYTGTLDLPLSRYGLERIARLSEADYQNKLLPVLQLGDPPPREDLIARAQEVLRPMLEFEENDLEYINRLQKGEYLPELLFPFDLELAKRLADHPALRWKAQHAKVHFDKKGR